MKSIFFALVHLPQQVLMVLVEAYRLLISPSLGASCRFEPTCSTYSLQALQQHGAVIGSYLTLRRLGRCQPWCEGGHDPVPQCPSASFFGRLLTPAVPPSSKKTPS